MDLSDIIQSGTWKTQMDSPVAQLSASIKSTSAPIFAGSSTLFNPGARVTTSLILGNQDPYPIGTAYLDDVDFDEAASTVPISGRNAIGFKLRDQTFDTTTEIEGMAHEVAAAILEMGGLTSYRVQLGDHNWVHKFKPEQTLLSGLQQLMKFYFGWQMVELDDGMIVIGIPSYIAQYVSNSYYDFNIGSEVFKRKTRKTADAAYSHVYVTGKGAGDVELDPVFLPVNHFNFWAIGNHKTCHITAPDGLTQQGLSDYAAQCALDLQYVGVGEQFVGPLKPHLLVGDVAAGYESGDAEAISLGLVTAVTQHFGGNGFYTEYSVDSGGEVTDGENYVVTRNAVLTGYNRRPRMTDLIRSISHGSKWGN